MGELRPCGGLTLLPDAHPATQQDRGGRWKNFEIRAWIWLWNYHHVQNRLSVGRGGRRCCLSCSLTSRYKALWNYIVLQIRAGIVIVFYIGWIYLAVYISGSLPRNRDASFHQWWNWDQVTYLRYHKQPDPGSKRKWVSCLPDLSIYMPRPQRQTGSTSWLAHGLQGDARRLMLRAQIGMSSRFAFLPVQPLNCFRYGSPNYCHRDDNTILTWVDFLVAQQNGDCCMFIFPSLNSGEKWSFFPCP